MAGNIVGDIYQVKMREWSDAGGNRVVPPFTPPEPVEPQMVASSALIMAMMIVSEFDEFVAEAKEAQKNDGPIV